MRSKNEKARGNPGNPFFIDRIRIPFYILTIGVEYRKIIRSHKEFKKALAIGVLGAFRKSRRS